MKIKVAYAITASYCTFDKVLQSIKELVEKNVEVIPILSFNTSKEDTRFIKAEDFKAKLFDLTGNKPLDTLQQVEPFGPKRLVDVVLIAPCTGNTMAKLVNSITDTPVLMVAKSHLRNNSPVVIAMSTNDGLSNSAKNIGKLLNTKNIYFVPFLQDDPKQKPNSLQADFSLLYQTIEKAIDQTQIQPILAN